MKIEGAVTAMISEYPFKFQTFWKSIPISYKLLQVSLQKSAVPFHLVTSENNTKIETLHGLFFRTQCDMFTTLTNIKCCPRACHLSGQSACQRSEDSTDLKQLYYFSTLGNNHTCTYHTLVKMPETERKINRLNYNI